MQKSCHNIGTADKVNITLFSNLFEQKITKLFVCVHIFCTCVLCRPLPPSLCCFGHCRASLNCWVWRRGSTEAASWLVERCSRSSDWQEPLEHLRSCLKGQLRTLKPDGASTGVSAREEVYLSHAYNRGVNTDKWYVRWYMFGMTLGFCRRIYCWTWWDFYTITYATLDY